MSRLSVQRFSLTLIVALFLCQVLGAFCPMVVPATFAGDTALHQLHTGHPHATHGMLREGTCPDSLITPLKASDMPLDASVSADVDTSEEIPFTSERARHHARHPHESSPLPLYTLLSTFRI